jgi:hypothetical protein
MLQFPFAFTAPLNQGERIIAPLWNFHAKNSCTKAPLRYGFIAGESGVYFVERQLLWRWQ